MPDAGAQSESRIDYREIPKQSCKTANPHRTAFQCSHISKLGWVPQYRQRKAHTESSRIRRTVVEDNNDSKLTPLFFQPAFAHGITGMRGVCGHPVFFPESPIERLIPYFILAKRTHILMMRATETALTLHRIQQRFTVSAAIHEPAFPHRRDNCAPRSAGLCARHLRVLYRTQNEGLRCRRLLRIMKYVVPTSAGSPSVARPQ